MDNQTTSDDVTQQEFIEAVLGGGKGHDAMEHLVMTSSPALGVRASEVRQLGQFVSDVLSILRSPINPFEGMLEAPSPIVRLYQAHKQTMKELRPHRDGALQPLLLDALAALYDRVAPISWTTIEAAGFSRSAPREQNQGVATENP